MKSVYFILNKQVYSGRVAKANHGNPKRAIIAIDLSVLSPPKQDTLWGDIRVVAGKHTFWGDVSIVRPGLGLTAIKRDQVFETEEAAKKYLFLRRIAGNASTIFGGTILNAIVNHYLAGIFTDAELDAIEMYMKEHA